MKQMIIQTIITQIQNNIFNCLDSINKPTTDYQDDFEFTYKVNKLGVPLEITLKNSNFYARCDYIIYQGIKNTKCKFKYKLSRIDIYNKSKDIKTSSAIIIYDDYYRIKYNLLINYQDGTGISLIKSQKVTFKLDKDMLYVFDNKSNLIDVCYFYYSNFFNNHIFEPVNKQILYEIQKKMSSMHESSIISTVFCITPYEDNSVLCITIRQEFNNRNIINSDVLNVQVQTIDYCKRLYDKYFKKMTISPTEAYELISKFDIPYYNKVNPSDLLNKQIELIRSIKARLHMYLKDIQFKKDNNIIDIDRDNGSGSIPSTSIKNIIESIDEYLNETNADY